MRPNYQKIFDLAIPYLKQGMMKDFVVHTQGVVQAMELIVAGEGGDERILIPAAILHDVGFSKVSKELQTNADLEKKREAQRQHLTFAKDIIKEILSRCDYHTDEIDQIVKIVQAHKFQDPIELEKQMLIDADNLSDVFKDQFEMDIRVCGFDPRQNYEYRAKNTFYTQTAQTIFRKELAERLRTIT